MRHTLSLCLAAALAANVAVAQAPANDEPINAIPVFDGINPGPPTGLSGFSYSSVGATTTAGYTSACGSFIQAASAARCGAGSWPSRSLIRCRYSINRSRRGGPSPSASRSQPSSSARTAASTPRPLGAPRRRSRAGPGCGVIGIVLMAVQRNPLAPLR